MLTLSMEDTLRPSTPKSSRSTSHHHRNDDIESTECVVSTKTGNQKDDWGILKDTLIGYVALVTVVSKI